MRVDNSLFRGAIKTLCLVIFILYPGLSWSQLHEPCGTMEYLRESLITNPAYADSIKLNEKRTQQWIKDNEGLRTSDSNLIIIPVVVHVVYNINNPQENISDWEVQSQIDVLNEDYRRLNVDTIETPAPFLPLATDCNIEFCLAKRDPNNNRTNGIVRTPTITVFSDFNSVKSSSTGGDNPWPYTRYLNVWVCNMQGQGLQGRVIGYGTFPGGDPTQDGIVVNYAEFGRYNNTIPGYNLGRTATHEVGHWLNLHHPWGDYESGCDTSHTDYVDDTPQEDSADYGCLTFPAISCDNGPNGDLFCDYMNYSYDDCANMFTHGQKQRMWAALNTSRPGILDADGCNPVTNFALDIGVSQIYLLPANVQRDSVTPVVTISNYGTETVTTASINYKFNNGLYPRLIYNWTGNLSPGQSTDVTLPNLKFINPEFIFIAYTSNPNGGQDMDTSNDFRSSRSLLFPNIPTTPTVNPFIVYPNPNYGSFTIQFNSPDLSSLSLQVLNTLGQILIVKTTTNPSDKLVIQMAQLPPGLYIMRVTYKGTTYTEKIMHLHPQ